MVCYVAIVPETEAGYEQCIWEVVPGSTEEWGVRQGGELVQGYLCGQPGLSLMGTLQCVSDWSRGVRKVGNMSPSADGCLWAVNYLAMGWHPSVQRHLRAG